MKIYLTEQDAIYGLHQNGYTHDFQISGNDLLWVQEKVFVRAGDFAIDECHQFIDNSRKEVGIIIFGVAALYHNIKGILIRHYEINSLKIPPAILKKLKDMSICSPEKIPDFFNTKNKLNIQ